MNKFILNGAGIIDLARLHYVQERSCSLVDNRFAVVNGLLFDMLTLELSQPGDRDANAGFSCSVAVYDATECYNASHGDDIREAYTDKNFIVAFEFFVSEALCNEDNQFCIDAERSNDALFLHLIEHALKDSNNAETRFRNFARGLDLDHIQGVA